MVTSCRVGANDDEGVRKSLATQIVLSAGLTVVLTALALALLKPMLAWINVTPENPEVYGAAFTYCAIIFGGIGAQLFYNFVCSFLRSMGDSVTPLLFLLFSTVLNVGLDLLFIIVFRWGVAGAAAATVSAQLISTIGCFIYAFTKYPKIRPLPADWKIDWQDALLHAEQGIPLGLQFSVLAVGIIVMQSVVVKFDIIDGAMVSNAAQNGFGAANKLHNLLMTPLSGLGSAMTSFTAQNMGADRADRIKKGTLQALLMMLVIAGISIATGLLLSIDGTYLKIFLSADKITEETVRFGNHYLYIDLSLYVFLGFIFVMRNCVQGIGRPQFILGAGAAELVARVAVCLLLPAAGMAQGLPDFFQAVQTGLSEGLAVGAAQTAAAMDKDLTKRLVSEYVITPQWRTVRYTEGDIARLVSETKLPCVVKPVANGSSVGVSIAHTGAELKKALEECLQFGAQVVLEQYISGREIQVGIIAGKALPSIEIIPKTGFYDYANKYQAGAAEEICPSPIPEDWEMRVRTATETVYRLIGLSVYSRADFIVTPDGTPYFLEINTLPGMTKTSLLPQEAAAVGIGYEELCEKIVEESLKQKRGL